MLNNFIKRVNNFQLKYKSTSFIVAVIKKYGDDETGRKAALLTYYGFLSLFPLLLILTTVCDIIVGSNSHIKTTIINSLTNYFPLLGNQLSEHVHAVTSRGLPLLIGILFLFYGTRGVADVFRSSIQDVWYIPKTKREKFPDSLFKSLAIIIVGGFGLLATSLIASSAAGLGHGFMYRFISIVINGILLFCLINFLMIYSLPKTIKFKDIWPGAAVATIGLLIIQLVGGAILDHELRKLNALYSYFAVTLGIMFWAYLLSQIIYYSVQFSVVSSFKLWPRSLVENQPTAADKRMTKYLREELD